LESNSPLQYGSLRRFRHANSLSRIGCIPCLPPAYACPPERGATGANVDDAGRRPAGSQERGGCPTGSRVQSVVWWLPLNKHKPQRSFQPSVITAVCVRQKCSLVRVLRGEEDIVSEMKVVWKIK